MEPKVTRKEKERNRRLWQHLVLTTLFVFSFKNMLKVSHAFLEANTLVIGRNKGDQSVFFSMTIPAVSTEPFNHSVAIDHFAYCCPSEKNKCTSIVFPA